MDHIKFEIPGKPAYLTMVRLAISSAATTAGFDLDDIEDVKTAVTEACKQISCHGLSGFSDKYGVALDIEEKHLEIKVTDECGTHTLEKLDKPCQNCPQDGNLSLMVIRSLMTTAEAGINPKDGMRTITMTKDAEQ